MEVFQIQKTEMQQPINQFPLFISFLFSYYLAQLFCISNFLCNTSQISPKPAFFHSLELSLSLVHILSVQNCNKKMYPKFKVRTEGQSDKHGVHECNWNSLLSLKDVPLLLLQDSCFPVKDYGDMSTHCETRIPKSNEANNLLPASIVLPAQSASEGSDKKSNSNEEDRPNSPSDKKSIFNEEDRPNIRSDKKTKFNKENTPNIRSYKKSKFNEMDRHNIRSDKKHISGEGDRPNIRASSVPRPHAVLSSPDNDAVMRNKSRVKALRPSPLKTHSAVQSRHTQSKTIHGEAIDDKSSPSLRKPKDKTDTGVDLRAKKRSAMSMPHKSVTPAKPSSVQM